MVRKALKENICKMHDNHTPCKYLDTAVPVCFYRATSGLQQENSIFAVDMTALKI